MSSKGGGAFEHGGFGECSCCSALRTLEEGRSRDAAGLWSKRWICPDYKLDHGS